MFLNQAQPQTLSEILKHQVQDFISNLVMSKNSFDQDLSTETYIATEICTKRVQELEQKRTMFSLGLSDWR